VIYYVGAVMATNLFGAAFPDWFRQHCEIRLHAVPGDDAGILVHGHRAAGDGDLPVAWAFFVPFILVTTFTALNLFIGVVVSAMQAEINVDRQKAVKEAVAEGEEPLVIEVRALRAEMARLAKVIEQRPG